MSESLNKTEHIDLISRTVRAGLDFVPNYSLGEHAYMGNCYEFASRTHDLLAHDGFGSYIVYSNGHAFNIGAKDDDLFFVSSDVPGLSADQSDSPSLDKLFNYHVSFSINTGFVPGYETAFIDMTAITDALSPEAANAVHKYNNWFSEFWLQSKSPGITIMQPDYALRAMANYMSFRRAIDLEAKLVNDRVPTSTSASDHFEQTRDSLERLRIHTPQHETRPQYNEELKKFHKLVRTLSRAAVSKEVCVDANDLTGLINSYVEILPSTNTSANVVFGDCFRDMGKVLQNRDAVANAKIYYKEADTHSQRRRGFRQNPLIKSKSDKVEALLQSI